MLIRNKLTLIYAVITGILVLLINLYIFAFTRSYIDKDFFEQLQNRVDITAKLFLEADEESAATIKIFEKKYLKALPDEIIRIYNAQNQSVFIDSSLVSSIDQKLINKVRTEKELFLTIDQIQYAGIYYKDNQGDYVIIASAYNRNGNHYLNELLKMQVLGFLVSMIIIVIAGRYFTKQMLKPVADITESANIISETNLHLRLNEGNRKDELAHLSIVINNMLERLEDAFEQQKTFVANASHELRTPLTSIIGNIDVALTKPRNVQEYEEVLDSIQCEADRLHKLLNGLLSIAQSNVDFNVLQKDEIRIDELLFEIKDSIKARYPDNQIEIQLNALPDDPESLITSGDKNLLTTALLNITDNACKFSGQQKVTLQLFLNKGHFIIRISDTGIGISPEQLPHITETFYRADNARTFSGSGIGLALADKIIQLHHGHINIMSELNSGTTVEILLPKY